MNRKRLVLIIVNVLSVPASLFFAFMLFVAGAFASDSGTSAAMAVSFTVMGIALLYPILAIGLIYLSQRRRSLWIALMPFILPFLLIAWAFTPWFSFS